MAKVMFKDETEYEASYAGKITAAIDEAVKGYETAIADLRSANDRLEVAIADLRSQLTEASTKSVKPVVDKFAAFASHPEFHAAISATTLLPTSLPTLAAFEVFKGATKASAIQAIIPATNAIGGRGGGSTTVRSIIAALETAGAAFLAANKGIGIKIATFRGTKTKAADAEVRVFRFKPIEEIVEAAGEPVDAAVGEQKLAA